MRHTGTYLVLTLALALVACKKDEADCPDPAPPAPTPAMDIAAFSHLDSGNYWVYERFRVDSMDVPDPTNYRRDSLYIAGDTLVDGYTWKVVRLAVNGVTGPIQEFWRDSANYLLKYYRSALFATNYFDQAFYIDSIPAPSTLAIHYAVGSSPVSVSVPTGTYTSYLVTGTCYSYGGFPTIPAWKYPRTYWVEGIGRVKWYAYFMNGNTGYRYQLVNYHVD